MKKYILLLIILAGCAKPLFKEERHLNVPWHPIDVSTPNSGAGDKLRDAFIQVNTTLAAQSDTNANKYTKAQILKIVQDSLNRLRDSAINATPYFFAQSDSNARGGAMTYNGVVNYVAANGGGGGSKFYYLSGRVDDLGFPDAGDSTLVHTNFPGKHMTVVREGQIQQQHADNTVSDGFRFDNLTGTITFRPVLSAGEQLEIWATNTVQWEALSPEGGGGEGESTLLTGLRAGWQMDEATGTAVNEVLDTYPGVTSATVNVTGKFGKAETFSYASGTYATFGATVGDVGTNDWSYAIWVKLPSLPSANRGILGNYVEGSPFYHLRIGSGNLIVAAVNFGGANIECESNAAITATTWTHIAVTHDRSGSMTLYVNKVAQTDSEVISGSSAVAVNNAANFNIGNIGNATANWFIDMTADDAYLFLKVLTQDEIDELYLATYPWN